MPVVQKEDGRYLVSIYRKGMPRTERIFDSFEQAQAFELDYLNLYGEASYKLVDSVRLGMESTTKRIVKVPDFERILARRLIELTEKADKTKLELLEQKHIAENLCALRLQEANNENERLKLAYLKTQADIKLLKKQGLEDEPSAEGESRPKKHKGREKKEKNEVGGITEERIMQVLDTVFYAYQRLWWAAKEDAETRRNRFILKSRQIGATYYFAFEALADAIINAENQIFLSASRDQAEVFKAYIIAFALEHFGVELKGQGVITLSNGAELRFLSTNSRTAQSYHGHLYVDECFWIPGFEKMWKVASGMSAHKKWRRTLFSTPSAISHEAHKMWSGEKFNESLGDESRVEFINDSAALKGGILGKDKIWRHLVTVKDAEAQGCDLFDIDELQAEYSADDFANLFMCKFIDDAQSVFNLKIMMTCYALQDYDDYNAKAARPFGNRPVAIGYDPSRTRDNASLSILAIPLRPDDKWRVLQTLDFNGQNFQYQATRIREMCETHNVQHLGIDTTGIGYGLFELVEQFYRRVTPINYSNETKTQLVMKAIDVIENGRFEFESGNKRITQAFMMICKTTTNSGVITYASGRSNTNGHSDIAWSIMHALAYEPIAERKKTTVVFG